MTIFQGRYVTIDEVRKWFTSVRHVLAVCQKRGIIGQGKNVFSIASIVCAMISLGTPLTAWTADSPSLAPEQPGKVVVAGVGYENADTSMITVKVYDAGTGAILSDETYELNVREDAVSAGGQPRERIFAGGVGPGTDGLSAFTLRVYDAATGRFLWEGLLNLNVGNQESDSSHRVVARLAAPQATVMQVQRRIAVEGQPQFFLRSVDPVTGQLVWTDHFSAGAGRVVRAERVSSAVMDQQDRETTLTQQIEFRIQMMDDGDRKIMWEDTIEPTVGDADMIAGHDAAAENLPVWHGGEAEEIIKEVI
jgi:hypothetical protein